MKKPKFKTLDVKNMNPSEFTYALLMSAAECTPSQRKKYERAYMDLFENGLADPNLTDEQAAEIIKKTADKIKKRSLQVHNYKHKEGK